MKNKLIKLSVAFILLAIFSFLLTTIIFPKPTQVTSYKMRLTVSDHLGIGGRGEYLDFGLATPGSTITKSIQLLGRERARVKIYVKGELAKWTGFSENDFILEPEEEKIILISVFVPKDAEHKDYYGEVNILIFRQK